MANQHTKAAEAAAAAAGAPPITDDAPDLGPEVPPVVPEAEPTLELTQSQLDDMLAKVADDAAERATRAAQRAGIAAAAPVVNVHNQAPVPTERALALVPDEPTYEDGFTDEDGVAYAGTIIAVSPEGVETECTPKVFRVVLAPQGFLAHPADAVQNLSNEPRRTRRGQRTALDGDSAPEQVVSARRRRRAAASG